MITLLTKQQLGPQMWELTWASDLGGTPTFYVYRDGILALSTTRTSHRFQVFEGEILQIEVLDDANTLPATVYPRNVLLQWEPVANSAKYLVQQWDGAAWDTIRTVLATGRAVMSHSTAKLTDGTQYKFRVVPVGTNGVNGTAREWTIDVVGRPDAPVASGVYDSGTGLVTFTVA